MAVRSSRSDPFTSVISPPAGQMSDAAFTDSNTATESPRATVAPASGSQRKRCHQAVRWHAADADRAGVAVKIDPFMIFGVAQHSDLLSAVFCHPRITMRNKGSAATGVSRPRVSAINSVPGPASAASTNPSAAGASSWSETPEVTIPMTVPSSASSAPSRTDVRLRQQPDELAVRHSRNHREWSGAGEVGRLRRRFDRESADRHTG